MASRILQCRPYRYLSGLSSVLSSTIISSSSSSSSGGGSPTRRQSALQQQNQPRVLPLITLAMSSFHSSPVTLLPVRRRRRSQALTAASAEDDDDEDSDDENSSNIKKKKKNDERSRAVLGIRHEAVLDSAVFLSATKLLIDKVEKALQPMKHANDPFLLTRGYEEDMGEFLLLDLGPLVGEWVGEQDGHSFEGLLVRDLIRQCNGLPKL